MSAEPEAARPAEPGPPALRIGQDPPLLRIGSAPRTLVLLLGLKGRQAWNRWRSHSLWPQTGHHGTGRVQSKALGVSLLLFGLFLYQSYALSARTLDTLAFMAYGPAYERHVTALLLLLGVFLVCTLFSFRNRDLLELDQEIEWLLGLPIPGALLGYGKILEHSLSHLFGWVLGLGFFTALLARSGLAGPGLYAAAFGLTLALNLQSALLHYPLLLLFRRSLPAAWLQNLQAGFSVLSIALLLVLSSYPRLLGGQAPGWLPESPVGLISLGLRLGDAWLLLTGAGSLLTLTALALALCQPLAVGGLEAVRSLAAESPRRAKPDRGWLALPGIAGRELLVLGRDRALLIQVLLMPLILVLLQTWAVGDLLGAGAARHWPLLCLLVLAYLLQTSLLPLLAAERRAFWQLYTLPRGLGALLARKAGFWLAFSLGYCLLLWLIGLALSPVPLALALRQALWLLVAGGLLGSVAAALGIIGADVYAGDERHSLGRGSQSLFGLSVALVAMGLYLPEPHQQIATLVICAIFSLALIQKALDRLPYLLDLSALPPRQLELVDGLVSLIVFFMLQLGVLLLGFQSGWDPEPTVLWAFALAGLGTVPAALWSLKRQGIGLRQLGWIGPLRVSPLQALVTVLIASGACISTAWLYLQALASLRLDAPEPGGMALATMLLLSGVLAPCFEEMLFRGLLQQSLVRTLGFRSALLIASLLFAMVHPAHSMLPVFGVGLAAGWAFARTGHLAAAILVHAAYNVAVVLWG